MKQNIKISLYFAYQLYTTMVECTLSTASSVFFLCVKFLYTTVVQTSQRNDSLGVGVVHVCLNGVGVVHDFLCA